MTTFDIRQRAFEDRFAQDEALRFKTLSRRNKELGLWIAGLIGKTGAEAERFVAERVTDDYVDLGEDKLFELIRDRLAAAGVEISDHRIHRTMEELLAKAKREIMAEG